MNNILLVAGSWSQTLLLNITGEGIGKAFMYMLSTVFTVLAIWDTAYKLHWKVKQRRREKTSGHGLSERDLSVIKEIVKEFRHSEQESTKGSPIGFKH